MNITNDPNRLPIYELPFDVLCNLILVSENIRPAFMVQYIDYQESFDTDPISSKILHSAKDFFPDLIHTRDVQGTIISKKQMTDEDHNTDKKMGELLGYPCAKDYNILDKQKSGYKYIFTVNVTVNTPIIVNPVGDTKYTNSFDLFANGCIDESTKPEFEKIKEKIDTVLKKCEYTKTNYKETNIRIIKTATIDILIDKIVHKNEITDTDSYDIMNELYNKIDNYYKPVLTESDFKYKTNDFHRGVLSTLLALCENDSLEAFYPLIEEYHSRRTINHIKKTQAKLVLRIKNMLEDNP